MKRELEPGFHADGTCWVVTVNTDLTEGRGRRVVKAVCETEATALRLAHGADVQGTNGQVNLMPKARYVDEEGRDRGYYAPASIVPPDKGDREAQSVLDRQREVREKALRAGLTDDDLSVLRTLASVRGR